MTVRCVDCNHGRLRDEAGLVLPMVRHGTINCTRSLSKASFFTPLTPRECGRFEIAKEATRTARIQFFTKQKENQ